MLRLFATALLFASIVQLLHAARPDVLHSPRAKRQVPPINKVSTSAENSVRKQWRASDGGCENGFLNQVIMFVVPPLVENRHLKLGDVARAVQQAAQMGTGHSFEVLISKKEMVLNTHSPNAANSCRSQVNDYFVILYQTPTQYNPYDFAEENFFSNFDHHDPLGSSQAPFQQQPFIQPLQPVQPLQQPPLLQVPAVQPPNYYPPVPIVPPVVPPLECFSGDTVIETSKGSKRMYQITVGDEVLSLDQSMISFTPVILFLHRDEQVMAQFNEIRTEGGERVKLTNEHMVHVNDCQPGSSFKLVSAKLVTTEHCIIVARGPVRMLITERVKSVRKTFERGIYAPLTKTGDIFANSILCSCYSNRAAKTLQNSFFSCYSLISFLLPEQSNGLSYGIEYFMSVIDVFVPINKMFA